MYQAMASLLWKEAALRPVCFGVTDIRTDRVLALLRKTIPAHGKLRVLPGISAADQCLASLPPDLPYEGGLQLFSAVDILSCSFNPSLPLLITELDSALLAGEVRLRLGNLYNDEQPAVFFPPSVETPRTYQLIPLFRLNSRNAYDHTAALFLPGIDMHHRDRHTFDDLERIVSRLRAPDGCPWDSVQTHRSLAPFMVEEAWEAVNAIEDDDMDHLSDELGDVLFQVFIHASIGESFDEFSLTDIISGICRKMIRRHPHVFGQNPEKRREENTDGWEKLKRTETGSKTVGESLNDVSSALPALKYASKLFKKLSQIPPLLRRPEEIANDLQCCCGELLQKDGSISEEAACRILLLCTEICRRFGLDAEQLLHRASNRLKYRYQRFESAVLQDGKAPESLTVQEFNVYWQQAGV